MARSRTNHKSKKFSFVKRYVKLLSVSPSAKHTKHFLSSAPVPVLKLISNAAIHASRGKIHLSDANKKLFRKNNKLFKILISKDIGFEKKRSALIKQRGGGFFIPALISTVLSAIGPALFGLLKKNE